MSTVTITFGGKTFEGSERLRDHLNWTKWRLRKRYPWASLRIIQGSYQPGKVAASAGTHNKDAVVDVRIVGITWKRAQNFLRYSGWAAWTRTPDQGPWSQHIHMISIPEGITDKDGKPTEHPTEAQVLRAFARQPTVVGDLVPAQVRDYYAHALGLKGHHQPGSDPTLHPDPINRYVFTG